MTALVITTAVVLATRGDPTPAHTGPPAAAVDPGTASPTPSATPVTFSPGAAGVGDPYFPLEGNGGYDVGHYDLALSYSPTSHRLAGTVTITATATQNLSRFDLDLSGLQVSSVSVDRTAATYSRVGQELRITPSHGLVKGVAFTTAVRYAGVPRTITGSPVVFGSPYGWQFTGDGSFVGDEPNAASTWFPSNDHPSDKATYTFRIRVPASRSVVANGDLVSRTRHGQTATYVWNETRPMATYLATIDVGNWTFVHSKTSTGIPNLTAYDPALKAAVAKQRVVATTNAVTAYWAKEFGPYPFTSTGAIVDNLPTVGFSLETQTRPLYGFAPDPGTLSHELAHQWFGDSVSVATWRDIWLNEGFATFAADLWAEHTGVEAEHLRRRAAGVAVPPRQRVVLAAVDRRPRPQRDVQPGGLLPRRDDAGSVAAPDRRRGLLPAAADLDVEPSLRQRRHGPVRRARSAGLGSQPHGVLPDLAVGQEQAGDLRLRRQPTYAARPAASATASFCRNDADVISRASTAERMLPVSIITAGRVDRLSPPMSERCVSAVPPPL